MFTTKVKIKWYDVDAAGVVFYGRVFYLFHDAYEQLMSELGFSLKSIIETNEWHLPIVHADCDLKAPIRLDETLTIHIKLFRLGQSSFSLTYEMLNENQKSVANGQTVHAVINVQTGKKQLLAETLKNKLNQKFLS